MQTLGDDNSNDNSDYIWGVLCTICGNLSSNLGVNIQKLSIIRHVDKGSSLPYFKQPLWWAGLVLYQIGQVFEGLAFGLAAQSLVATLTSCYIVYNIFFASWLLKEKFYPRVDTVSTVAIVAGAILTTLSSNRGNTEYTLQELLSFFGRTTVILYLILNLLLCAVMWVMIIRLQKEGKEHYGGILNLPYRSLKLLRFLYPAFGGLLAGPGVLVFKALAEMVKYSVREDDNQFSSVVPVIMALYCGVTAVIQLHYLQVSLKYFDALYVVPVKFVLWTISVIIGGGAYYSEFEGFSVGQSFQFLIGVAFTLFGVYFVSKRKIAGRIERSSLPASDLEEDIHDQQRELMNAMELSDGTGIGVDTSATSTLEASFTIHGEGDDDDLFRDSD